MEGVLTKLANAAVAARPRADELVRRFRATREATLSLVGPLSAEDCQVQSMPDASPVKWHLAHTTWFFETFVLSGFGAPYTPFDDAYRMLFNSYYNAIGDKHPRPHRGLLSRPPLHDVMRYRSHVDHAITGLLQTHSGDKALLDLVEIGVNHEQQHQELILTDVKHMLSQSPLKPAYRAETAKSVSSGSAPMTWTHYDGGIVQQGNTGERFCFDNETPAHNALLIPYDLANRLITQQEFNDFISDGGYRRPELWLSMGWDKVTSEGWNAPMYWEGPTSLRAFTLFGLQEMDPHAPVTHISYFEADAYARWAQARLPREAEWEWAAGQLPASELETATGMLESNSFHPQAVAPNAAAISHPSQMFGEVWEWTCSPYDAYPKYSPASGAIGEYNGKFMCNQYVLRGGSCVTPRSHIRATYRNFFPPEARWQFSGLRLARDA
jgi:ergothioneine biosynthesis protein EgtB